MSRRWAVAVVATAIGVACTDVDLVAATNPVTVAGIYCTNAAATHDVPIRILLVIDTSRSMETNDPEGHRARAAADLISAFSAHRNVSFGFVEFNTAATQLTEGFVTQGQELTPVLNELNKKEGFTNYLDALGVAQAMVNDDIAKVATELKELEENGETTRFARPWYFVIFLSDGIPRMPGGILQDSAQILWRVEQIADVPSEAAGLTLHTAFLGASDAQQRAEAELLLEQMASAGGGTYTSFERGDEIDFTLFDFDVKRLFDIKQMLIYNRTAVLGPGHMVPDSDSDGVDDLEEEELGTDSLRADSDGDGCGDGFERAAGLLPMTADCPCDAENRIDQDNDGLADCEELYLGYDAARYDSDVDLFPDALELRVGTNAADSDDWREDLDFDGVMTGVEIRQGTNPNRNDTEMHASYALRYIVDRRPKISGGQTCYEFRVENIVLAPTQAVAGREAGVNEIVFETIEAPEDAAEEVSMLRRMVVPVPFSSERERVIEFSIDGLKTVSEQEVQPEEGA